MISFIGYYNYTVILTYISLFCSIAGMLFTVNGWYKMAVLCLALSGLCDMFDGKIARRKTDRTDDEKCFGIQIDSLCDMVCFGAFPILLALQPWYERTDWYRDPCMVRNEWCGPSRLL